MKVFLSKFDVVYQDFSVNFGNFGQFSLITKKIVGRLLKQTLSKHVNQVNK